MKQSIGITLIFLFVSACVSTQQKPSYQEFLMGGFDSKEWTVGNQVSDQNQRIIEFVRSNENIDNWTEFEGTRRDCKCYRILSQVNIIQRGENLLLSYALWEIGSH